MSKCHQCGKPVYFAERRTSLGKEWHRTCLRCEECGKVLHPGQHAEHKGVPYCSVPCYGVLFGPTMYGHGSPVEAHRSFGKDITRTPKGSPVKQSDLEMKLKAYNIYQEGRAQVVSREVNGRMVLEGVLRVSWGVLCPIQLQPKDDSLPQSWRRSYHLAIDNGLEDELVQLLKSGAYDHHRSKNSENGEECQKRKSSLDDLFQAAVHDLHPSPPNSPLKGQGQEPPKNVVMRRSKGRRHQSKRLSIFSGHEYNLETSVFTPTHGSVTNVRVTSVDATQEVINMLLDKFKVVNNPEEFCLCVVRASGETRVLREDCYPLLERVILGPLEDEATIFIMEKHRSHDITSEVAQFVNLPEPVLQGFLKKLEKDEVEDVEDLKLRYKMFRTVLQGELDRLENCKDR